MKRYLLIGGIEPYQSYAWSPTDDLLTPNEQTTVCNITQAADYYVTVEDSVGCKTTALSCEVKILLGGKIETDYAGNANPFI